ncbi:MAG: hypothetical protein LBT19_01500 [Candidatus Nomurabacteria bacterium]|jgi:hypothetical protein|nr:hypothetical protein [Candidatus Nomurabacteria bacterium]
MLNKILYISSAVSAILLVGLMTFTTPSGVGPFGVLVFFTLCYIICLGATVAICGTFFRIKSQFSKSHHSNIPKKSYYYGAVLAFAPVIILAMQSFGGVGLLEVGLVFLAILVACFLVSKRIL